MKFYWALVAAAALGLVGCGAPTTASNPAEPPAVEVPVEREAQDADQTDSDAAHPDAAAATAAGTGDSHEATSVNAAGGEQLAGTTPAPIESGKVELSPENTHVRFVGIHLPPRQPDPRTGTFDKFTGQAVVNEAEGALESLQVEFDATSIWTDAGQRLTDHLKSPDFFEVREYPTAKFESTRIEATDVAGQVRITGDLTLHGKTSEISFPATVQVSDKGLALHSQFSIQRSDFGMTYGPEQVGNEIKLTAIVGQPNRPE
jgi:polyisoprenoid-binding protein YceI